MNKDLHDIDDLFRSALDPYEETPSPGVKKNLEAALDKRDAESYKRKLILWKRTALLLLLLLTGFVLYETEILKTGSGRSRERTGDKTNYTSVEKHKETYPGNNVTDNTMNADPDSSNKETIKNKVNSHEETIAVDDNIFNLQKQKEISVPLITDINSETGFKNGPFRNKTKAQKTHLKKEQANSFGGEPKEHTAGNQPKPRKHSYNFVKSNDPLQREKINPLLSLKEFSFTKLVDGLEHSIKQLQSISDSLLKNSIEKNTKEKKLSPFKPFWMLTGFASYERAGYRLDSDLPTNITNIKHSEVHEPSFSMGILATRQLKRRWGLQTGLIYCLTNIGISPQKLYALQNPSGDISFKYITSSGYAYIKPGLGAPPAIGDSLITREGKHRLKFISVPLVVKYSIGKSKLSFNPGVGIEADFLTSAKVETEVESPSSPEIIFIKKLDGAKTFHLSVVADAELRYKLNNNLFVSLRPAIRFSTTPMTKNNVVETFPRSVGVGVGLTWKF